MPKVQLPQPTEKATLGKPSELGYHIEAYKLPVIDTQESLRNFSGYQVSQPYSLSEIQQGDTSGTTETDSKTDKKGSGGYTKIYSK